MNKKHILSFVLIVVLAVMLFAGCSPDKKGAENSTEQIPQENVTETSEEQTADGEEISSDRESQPEEDSAELILEEDEEMEIIVPNDQAIGGF